MSDRNESLDFVRQELDAVNASYLVDHAGKHIKVSFRANGKVFSCVIAKTASDWRSSKNARAMIRRLIKDAGLTPALDTPKPKLGKPAKPVPEPNDMLEQVMARLTEIELKISMMEKLEGEVHALADLMAEIKPQIIHNVTHVVKRVGYVPKRKRGA